MSLPWRAREADAYTQATRESGINNPSPASCGRGGGNITPEGLAITKNLRSMPRPNNGSRWASRVHEEAFDIRSSAASWAHRRGEAGLVREDLPSRRSRP